MGRSKSSILQRGIWEQWPMLQGWLNPTAPAFSSLLHWVRQTALWEQQLGLFYVPKAGKNFPSSPPCSEAHPLLSLSAVAITVLAVLGPRELLDAPLYTVTSPSRLGQKQEVFAIFPSPGKWTQVQISELKLYQQKYFLKQRPETLQPCSECQAAVVQGQWQGLGQLWWLVRNSSICCPWAPMLNSWCPGHPVVIILLEKTITAVFLNHSHKLGSLSVPWILKSILLQK